MTITEAKEFLESKGYTVISPGQKGITKDVKALYASYVKNHGNMAEVAREFGVSRERVRQVLGKHYNLKGTGFRDDTETALKARECFIKNNNNIPVTAKELGMTAWQLVSLQKKYFPELSPLKNPKRKHLSDLEIKESYLRNRGNVRLMAQDLNRHPSSLHSRMMRLGLEGKGNEKVSDEKLIELFHKHKGNQQKIADEAEITYSAVYQRLKSLRIKNNGIL